MKRDSQLMPFVPLVKYVPDKNAANRTPLTLSIVTQNSFPNTSPTVTDAINILSSVDPAAAMLDAGYGCTASATAFKNFLLQIIGTRALSEKDVAGMLCVLTKFVHSIITITLRCLLLLHNIQKGVLIWFLSVVHLLNTYGCKPDANPNICIHVDFEF